MFDIKTQKTIIKEGSIFNPWKQKTIIKQETIIQLLIKGNL